MKTYYSLAFLFCFLMAAAPNQAIAQTETAPERIITIQTHKVNPNGTVEDETIVKKGADAENFDIDAFIANQQGSVQVTEELSDGSYSRTIIKADDANRNQRTARGIDQSIDLSNLGRSLSKFDHSIEDAGKSLLDALDQETGIAYSWSDYGGPYLGVKELTDGKSGEPGLLVDVLRCAPAYEAGLRDRDRILRIDNSAINTWADLTNLMKNKKEGDALNIDYERNGEKLTAQATVSTRSNVSKSTCGQLRHGFLGVTPDETGANEKGVRVRVIDGQAAAEAGMQNGDAIFLIEQYDINKWSDIEQVLADTREGDKIKLSFRRDGKLYAKEITLSGRSSTEINIEIPEINLDDIEIQSRKKEACLGVYSSAADNGARITNFTDESAARESGLAPGDIITHVNDAAVHNHDELWNEIARYQPGQTVNLGYLHDGNALNVQSTLKTCRTENRIVIARTDNQDAERSFYTWDWNENDRNRLQEKQVITIRSGADGAADADAAAPVSSDRNLQLDNFKAFPNPSNGPLTIEFRAQALPTYVTLLDLSGRQLFREELNAFNGAYSQQFDLSEYAKGEIIIQVVQADKVFIEKVIIH